MTQISLAKIEDLFSYHPPKTPEDQENHDLVNKAAIEFAVELSKAIGNPAELTTLLREVQKLRMLANLAVSYERLGISYRQLFETDNPTD